MTRLKLILQLGYHDVGGHSAGIISRVYFSFFTLVRFPLPRAVLQRCDRTRVYYAYYIIIYSNACVFIQTGRRP